MTARWYRGYEVIGHRADYIYRISNLVRQNDLGSVIPCLHTEKLKGEQWQQFYLFLGFNTEQKSVVPPRILHILDSITIGHPVGDFEYADIKSMVSAGIDTEHYQHTLAYRLPVVVPATDPLDLSALEIYADQQPAPGRLAALNRLLFWLSATGTGSWPTFKRVSDLLTAATVGLDARHMFRRLRLLGHVEYAAANGLRWVICPPVLVQNSQPGRYSLAGQRVPKLLKALAEILEVEKLAQPTGEAPDLVQLHFNSEEEARQAITDERVRAVAPIRWGGMASMKLANVLPESGRNLACLLTPVSGFTISNFELEQWRGQAYVKTHFHQQTGLYRLSPHEASPRLLPQTLFFDAATDRWYSGPWYDLRYLAQRTAGVPCRVQYHAGLQRLAIPANYRWPDLYERALVLASGLLPLRSLDNGWYCFSDIPPELAQTLAHKLDATVEETA